MNSNYGKSKSSFDFDLGLGSSRPKSLNDQKNQTSSSSSYASYSSYSSTQPKPAWQPNKPSWTHQPAPTQPAARPGVLSSGPATSMVGDILGKSWASSGSTTGVGIVDKNPNLFGDLVSSALGGQGKSNSNVPLKNATPTPVSSASNQKSSFSMGNIADSLPKTGNSVRSGGNWGSSEGFGTYANANSGVNASINSSYGSNNNSNKGTNLGGPSMRSVGSGGGGGAGISSSKDPFGSLVDFGSKQSGGGLNSSSKSSKINANDDSFGDFQNVSKSSSTAFPSSGFSSINDDFMGVNLGFNSKMGDFGMPGVDFGSKNETVVQSSGGDPLDMLFSSSSAEVDDWGIESEFGGGGIGDHDVGGSTTELEGLPPPPAGVSASMAKNKGMDTYKQGQYADAIKWLSWAVVLLEKAGDDATSVEVLSSRASCYKEVGQYKKAVADCTKVLENDEANVSVLVQRALLYESMEKYRLGAEDLRTVLKIDPSNRIARSTIHRLTKLAD
ncbi:hypothetical protein FH972_015433 [Carpinus fangiana]|uniref:Uncharacterized protein n=1 Tax=Carpinus fangiana TaxID=176857 RepID=A0A5N6RFI5_9ROSI|nr:hypothetical protein FH972_015433 [Carpinus fangiana]